MDARARNLALGLGLFLLSGGPFAWGQEPAAGGARPASGAGLASSDWFGRVSEKIRAAEYRFSRVRGETSVWSAPNRAQGLRSRVDPDGIEVFPRSASSSGEGAPWRLVLGTRAIGRPGDLIEVPPGAVAIDGERTELDRGRLVEWFENGERGIEQGWTVASRPGGSDPLVIVLSIEGDLSLRIDEGGRSGRFVDAGGTAKLSYEGLAAWDAEGRELEARLVALPEGVGVWVDDAGAVYPVTVDPLLSDPAWTAESDQAAASFGASVSTAGDVNGDGFSDVVVGAWRYDGGQSNEGRAFVYHGSAGGLAPNPAWTGELNEAGAWFGFSVSTAGDVNGDGYSDVIVGASAYSNGAFLEGAIFVYHGSPTGLASSHAWSVESDQANAALGWSVSTAGDVNGDGYSDVVAGAINYDNGEANEGGAFTYLGSASGLASSPAWTAESDQASARLGWSVSTAGDVNGDGYSDVMVGADLYDNGEADEGRAFTYLGSASGLAPSPAWTAESDQDSARFGYSVSTAGDVNGDGYSDVIVGADSYDNGEANEGRASTYLGSASGLASSPAWTAESNQDSARFGYSVSTAGDVNGDGYSDVIVGTDWNGGAFAYHGSAGGLAATPAWEGVYGDSVSAAGDVNGDGFSDVIVGSELYDNGQSDEGGAFVYLGSACGLSATLSWDGESDQAGGNFGWAVSTAGDVNGDGFSDVVVGACGYDNGEANEGRALLYHGSASGLPASPAWTAEPDQADAQFGISVSTAGDVNGDGYSDVVVGAYRYDNGQSDEGRAFAYHGSVAGLEATPAWTAESDQWGSLFGWSVSTAGDVNGDGFSDVIVGAYRYDHLFVEVGRAFAYHGSAAGLEATPAWTVSPEQGGAPRLGNSVSTAGDVNGDGFSDVIVGASEYDNGEMNEGRAFVHHGSAAGLETTPSWTAEPDQAGALFGWSVSTAGDVNGDGYSDVIVGANEYDNGEANEGGAFVYHGSASGLAGSPAWTAESDQVGAIFGRSVATAGDVNGDGYSDVVVGAYRYDNVEPDEGRAFVYHGSASGLAGSPAWTAEPDQTDARLGVSVSTAGDVNGDGYSDVIVGAYRHDNGESDEGRAFVYLGNGGQGSGGGWVLAPRQRRVGGGPLDLLGRSDRPHAFRLDASLARGLAGFEWAAPGTSTARLEWQVAAFAEPFGPPESGVGLSTAGAPVLFDEVVLGLIPNASHRWRARFRTNNPLLPVTPWFSIPWNGRTEAKLRTAPSQGTPKPDPQKLP